LEDLVTVLKDAEERFQYFNGRADDGEDDELNAPVHAMLFLSALNKPEALNAILSFLENDKEAFYAKITTTHGIELAIHTKHIKAKHVYPFEAIVEELESLCRPNDVVVVMGAGPVWKIGKQFVEGQAEAAQTVA
jgi:hypothetical protein